MRVLGIESSCDESGIAVLDIVDSGTKLEIKPVFEGLYSQMVLHEKYGGVFPEAGAREHIVAFPHILEKLKSEVTLKTIDLISVITEPGLQVSLRCGVSFGYGLAKSLNAPKVDVNHLYAHFYSSFMLQGEVKFPSLFLLASGGHTAIYYVSAPENFMLIAETVDDAIGEAFDKSARVLGLPYPGGPQISKLSSLEDSSVLTDFGVSMKDRLSFSFSGLKTAFLYYYQKNPASRIQDLAKSFEVAASNNLIFKLKSILDININKEDLSKVFKEDKEKVDTLLNLPPVTSLVFAGGVAANKHIRKEVSDAASNFNLQTYLPELKYCGDNATQAALAGYFKYVEHHS